MSQRYYAHSRMKYWLVVLAILLAPVVGQDLAHLRERMVREQIEARGVRSPDVLAAMRTVPRHLFVPSEIRSAAYEDRALPIGYGQSISEPAIVALMSELRRRVAVTACWRLAPVQVTRPQCSHSW